MSCQVSVINTAIIICSYYDMAIQVVEFSNGGYKIRKVQHTQGKLLNFENWIDGGLRSFSLKINPPIHLTDE